VIDGDFDVVLLAPIVSEPVEELRVVLGNKMAPLQDLELTAQVLADGWCGRGRGGGDSRLGSGGGSGLGSGGRGWGSSSGRFGRRGGGLRRAAAAASRQQRS